MSGRSLWLALIIMLAVPGVIRPVQAATGREPVIIIPGVAGSELSAGSAFRLSINNGHGGTYTHDYAAGEKVWVNAWEAIASSDDDYFDAIKLQADGVTPVAPALYVSNIYESAYDDLIGYLQGQGYQLGVDLWIFPYDWRQDIRTTSSQLDAKITQALVATNGGRSDPAAWTIKRADIVAHSMGGMVARNYIADPARASRIDQLITLGSPQLGTPKFLKALLYGDTFGPSFLGIGLSPDEVKDVVQNMSGANQLLPSAPYYAYYDNSDSTRLRPYIEDRDVDGNGSAGGALSYSAVKQLLLNTGRNGAVLGKAESYHTAIDTQRGGGVNGVRWAALIGYGYGTLGQLREYTGSCWSWYRYVPCAKRDENVVDGDGTVALMSAAMGDPWRNTLIASGAQLWYIEREHGALVERDYALGIPTGDGPVLPWIGDLLRGATPMSATADAGFSVSSVDAQAAAPMLSPAEKLRGAWIAALGPVALELRDSEGKTTGRKRGETEAAAPAAPDTRYERLPGSEFVFAKRDAAYTLSLVAESEGSTDLKVRVLGGGKIERTAIYLGVALRANGRAELDVKPGAGRANAVQGWPALRVDADGDGVFEANVQAAAVLDERASADTAAPELTVEAPVKAGKDSRTVNIRWRAADAGAGLLLERATLDPDSAASVEVTNGVTVTLTPGQHRLAVLAQDRAGNATSREVTFTIK
jgi:pimeloyl-ACP methyl ester carboxylesterase